MVKLLLEKGAGLIIACEKGRVPLHAPARFGHMDMVKFLAIYGANIKAKTFLGRYPAFYSATVGSLEYLTI